MGRFSFRPGASAARLGGALRPLGAKSILVLAAFVAAAPPLPATSTSADRPGSGAPSALGPQGLQPERSITAGLRAPQRVAVNSRGEVLVADPGLGGIAIVDLLSGERLGTWPMPGIRSVAVDWADRVVVAGAQGAALYDRNRTLIGAFSPGKPLGAATDVAVDAGGRRYAVLHGKAGRVALYSSSRALELVFGQNGSGAGQLDGAGSIAFTSSGDVAVGDRGHSLVHVFSGRDGAYLRSLGGPGSTPGKFSQLEGLSTTSAGTIYAVDSFHSRVQSFDANGSPRETIGTFGDAPGQLRTPAGIAVSEAFGKVVVASINSSRLEVFRLPPRTYASAGDVAASDPTVRDHGAGSGTVPSGSLSGSLDANGDGKPDPGPMADGQTIPSLGGWGLILFALGLSAVGVHFVGRRVG